MSARDAIEDEVALRSDGWKWLTGGRLFDLSADPAESQDLSGRGEAYRLRERAMRRRVERWLKARRPVPPTNVSAEWELRERLRALGYME